MSNGASRGTRRRRAQQDSAPPEGQGKDRWILSYADFITLLFAFFVALYSLSLKNAGDSKKLTETLHGVFDAVQLSVKPINIGEPVIGEPKTDDSVQAPPIPPATPLVEEEPVAADVPSNVFTMLNQVIESQYQGLQASGQIAISESANWVNLELKSNLLFGSGEYELSNEAVALLMQIAVILQRYPSVVLVEGDTDDLPVSSDRLISNWHLSSLRSASVVEELVYRGMDPNTVAPIGFSSTNPKVRNTNEYSRQQNRRVVLRISKRESVNLHDYLFK